MAINFPTNPNNGDVHAGFTYNSTKGVWESVAPSMMPTSDTPPTSPSDGQMWFDTDGGGAFVYYEDADSAQWVEVIGSAGAAGADGAAGPAGADGSAAVYATVDDLPGTASAGDQAFVTASNRLYLWNGSGWYNIALINTTPTISGAASSYNLATDGTATTVTITATDPEGLPITYSIASDTSGNIATVTSNNNVFTITPSTNTADAGSFSLTFRASDGVNIATAVSSFTLQFSVENSNYTTALITSVGDNNAVNNSFVDSSTNSHTITVAGNATQSTFSPYRHGGYSTYFDGTGDFLTIPDHTSLDLGTGNFTIECWAYIQSTTVSYIFSNYSGPSAGVSIYRHSDGTLRVNLTGDAADITSTNTFPTNEWRHIALVCGSGSATLYVNGVSEGTFTGTIAGDSTTQTVIGAFDWSQYSGTDPLQGYISDFRIVKGSQVYTSAFTPPTERLTAITNTSLLTCHLPYIADGSTNGHAITVNGNTHTRPFAPYDATEYSSSSHGGSMYFDGSGDNLTTPTHASFSLGSGDLTIEGWFYNTSTAQYQFIFDGRQGGASDTTYLYTNNGTTLKTGFGNTGDATAATIIQNQWYHFALVRSGSGTNNVTLYLNGKNVWNITDTTDLSSSTRMTVGSRYNITNDFGGHVSDFRVVKGTAVYTADFTPPTAPLTAITNTSLLLSGTNAGIIDKSQSIKEYISSGSVSSTAQTKYLSSSIYFDGVNDYARWTNNEGLFDLGFNGEPFTMEWWQYLPSIVDGASIGPQTGGGFGGWNGTSGHQLTVFFYSGAAVVFYQWWNGSSRTDYSFNHGGAFSATTWQHVATVYDGTNLSTYVDGTRIGYRTSGNTFGSVTTKYAALGSNATTTGGRSEIYYSDVRITKGLARYSGTSFTPPTAALKG